MLRRRHARNVPGRRRAGAVVLLLAVGACAGDEPPTTGELADRRARQAIAAAAEAGLPEDVRELLGTAARAPAASFSATYRAGADRVVVHQRPPRRRVDVVVEGVAREAVVSDETGDVRCERPAGDPWTCTPVDAGDDDGGAMGFGAFSPELVARTVEALEDAAGGDAAPAWLCVAPDGVPLLVDRGDGSPELRAIAYRPGAAAGDVARPDRTEGP